MYCVSILTVLFAATHFVRAEDSQGCRQEQTGFIGGITSQSYPENYNNSISCDWLIKSVESTKIQLRFTDFQLEDSHECQLDFVEVHDGLTREAPLIARLCGNEYPDVITSKSNKLYIYFETDAANTYRGFEASWLALNEDFVGRSKVSRRQVKTDKCGGVFTAKSGVLTSPNYPNPYPADSTCYWKIKSDPFNQIVLTFEDFETEEHVNCRYDFLKIKDGQGKNTKVVGTYCGKNSPNVVRANTNIIQFELMSDATTQKKGFKATWKSEKRETVSATDCGEDFNVEKGAVSSPNYPNSEEYPFLCTWSITVPQGGLVEFSFSDLNMTSYPGCGKGYVQLSDSRTRIDTNLGLFCGTDVPEPIISTSNHLSIGFLSDGSGKRKGFKGTWKTIFKKSTQKVPVVKETVCDDEFLENTGNIVKNSGQTNCSWTISVDDGKNVIVSFAELNMHDDPDCRREHVEIWDGINADAPLLMRTCGQLKPLPVRSTKNEVTVKHIVINPNPSTKMKLVWESIDVGKSSSMFDTVTCGIAFGDQTVTNNVKGMLPWTVGIMGMFNRAHCGGAILSENYILTAAHCFERLPWAMLWTVRAGEYDLMSNEETEQTRKIRKIIIHPGYNPITYNNDIAILRLDRPLILTDKVRTVCLPTPVMDVPSGSVCPIAGWGITRYLAQRPSSPLERILPKIISQENCNKSYSGIITDNMICAGDDGLDSCQGDGGSPLSCPDNGRYYVVGLSSWGNGCAFPGKYGVYTDVRKKIAWIQETATDNS